MVDGRAAPRAGPRSHEPSQGAFSPLLDTHLDVQIVWLAGYLYTRGPACTAEASTTPYGTPGVAPPPALAAVVIVEPLEARLPVHRVGVTFMGR